ncbi:MAG: 23S rRNA (adenine(2503)-C(2))-methyltransferase RlmN [Bacteroidetes bacterium]|nr:MAG: 23S rRNA (adenine(2503)-C(2))-methyltransferase RlmN [Bacteroidota bacterium]
MEKQILLGLSAKELSRCAEAIGLKPFVGKQIAQWIYEKRATSFAEMTNISKNGREALEVTYTIGRDAPITCSVSRDGTKKYLFPAGGDSTIEAAMIPDGERRTLCLSTQSGCRMGCSFCATGQQDFQGNLDAAKILNQVLSVEESTELTNLVFMGMGEPFDNLDALMRTLDVLTAPWGLAMSPRRITVSTVGREQGLLRFLHESEAHLAISLHTPFEMERQELVPASRAFPITRLMGILKSRNWSGQRRLSFEYVVLRGVNDTDGHMEALARLLRGIPSLVNLIAYHPHEDAPYDSPRAERMSELRDMLNAMGIRATVRSSRGLDIEAACGLLAKVHAER